ncbi:hypothetical protein HPG69_012004, partial [Diceros bicornis minor]
RRRADTPQSEHSRDVVECDSPARPLLTLFSPAAPCRPCSDTEVLLAVCTSDFALSGEGWSPRCELAGVAAVVLHAALSPRAPRASSGSAPSSDARLLPVGTSAVCALGTPADPHLLPSAVVRGSIQEVTHELEQQESAIHLHLSRLYRQKNRVFQPAPEGGGWRGRVTTLLECGVRPGRGEFLFTGHMHFGEAWLGCAPRFKDFLRMYRDAEERGLNPCEMGVE